MQPSSGCPVRLLYLIEYDLDVVTSAGKRAHGFLGSGFGESALLLDGAAFEEADMNERHDDLL